MSMTNSPTARTQPGLWIPIRYGTLQRADKIGV